MVVERVVPDVEGVFMGAVEGDAMGAGGVAMGVVVVPTAGGVWLAAAGAGLEGEPEVFDCANAMPVVPRASAANAEVMKRVVFMECLGKCCRAAVETRSRKCRLTCRLDATKVRVCS